MDNLKIIIPSAGLGRRMKSYGPKCLVSLGNGQILLLRQLDILHKIYPDANITVVVGYEADKICKIVPSYVRIVENEFYDETNVARSICLGIRAIGMDIKKLLIVYGDLVFNEKLFNGMQTNKSNIVVDNNNQMLEGEVGLSQNANYVSNLSYGLPTKWAQIAYLTGKELELFKQIVCNKIYNRYFGFEILNMVLEQGGKIETTEPKEMLITEIDTSKDIDRATAMLKECK